MLAAEGSVRRFRTAELSADPGGSVLEVAVPGHRVGTGGVATLAPGERSYPGERHVHDFPEAFVILAGAGAIEIDGTPTGIAAGDVLVVAPGEDHHLVSSADRPLVTVWLHMTPTAGDGRA